MVMKEHNKIIKGNPPPPPLPFEWVQPCSNSLPLTTPEGRGAHESLVKQKKQGQTR